MFGVCGFCLFFFKQKTAYEMRISDWSSDVCSSDLEGRPHTASRCPVAPLPRCPVAPLPRCPVAPLPRCPDASAQKLDIEAYRAARLDPMGYRRFDDAGPAPRRE